MRGGARKGAGRKRIHSKGVAHREREIVHSKVALHVNFKYRLNIRNKERLRLLKRAILNSRKKGLKVIHYSLQKNHVHLIVEALDNFVLESGMRSLTVTLARGIGMGQVQLQRYHLHVLRTLRETRNALHYVLFNEQRHTGVREITMTGFSSLHYHKEIKSIARQWGMKLHWVELKPRVEDTSGGMILQRVLRELTSSSLDTASEALRRCLCP